MAWETMAWPATGQLGQTGKGWECGTRQHFGRRVALSSLLNAPSFSHARAPSRVLRAPSGVRACLTSADSALLNVNNVDIKNCAQNLAILDTQLAMQGRPRPQRPACSGGQGTRAAHNP